MHYTSYFRNLIELERKAEMEKHRQEIECLSAWERKVLGRCEYGLKGKAQPKVFHYHVVTFKKWKPLDTKISTGDLVLVSRGEPLTSDLTGTVLEMKKCSLTVAFETTPPKWVYSGSIRIDLYTNDIPHKRMIDNLHWFDRIKHPLKSLVLGERRSYPPKPISFTPENKALNNSQKKAISQALGSRDMFLIHGPPGTGKTTTLTELIYQAVQRGKRVLCTAESNTATDNLLVKLAKYPEMNIVRVGHPARIIKGHESYSLYAHFERHPAAKKFLEKKEELKKIKEQQKKFQHPKPSLRRGMSDSFICQRARSKKGFKGIRVRTMCSMYGWIKSQEKIGHIAQYLEKTQEKVFQEIIENADIVIATNCTTGSPLMERQYFDLAVIDEGSQQVEPSTLIPLIRARRVVIAGDHKQLPPTVIHRDADALKNTLFARLRKQFPENTVMLETQYRMNEDILRFPRRQFYNAQLHSHKSVKTHTIADLIEKIPGNFSPSLRPEKAVAFCDTSCFGVEAFEQKNQKSYSFQNEHEAQKVHDLIEELLQMGIRDDQIGVITPYQAQVRLLKKKFLKKDIEINSIDGFQGREKEVIFLSLVRANEDGNLGFLKDLRRLNVAITRAKRKLIIIGHGDTLKNDEVYDEWIAEIA